MRFIMNKEEFLTRYDNKEKFSEDELESILWDLEGAEEVTKKQYEKTITVTEWVAK